MKKQFNGGEKTIEWKKKGEQNILGLAAAFKLYLLSATGLCDTAVELELAACLSYLTSLTPLLSFT